ncbi:NUDIX domain-containing protein [Chryseobacterium sp. KACC 21268]|nr:NUDIX domain-containing protein [Chryseobacterium sp. KACC 21268]
MTENHKNKQNLKELIDTNDFVEHVSVDCVIFGFHKDTLKVLLLKYHDLDLWSVPGGFIFNDENLNDAAARTLHERTHLSDVFLEQFYTFGDIKRTENNTHQKLLENKNIEVDKNHWIYQRFISVGYCALIDYTLTYTFPDSFNEVCQWFNVNELPNMAFDHQEMIEKGLLYLRKNIDYQVMGSNLLPDKFTMKELQNLYESILGEPLRRNNFQRKILGMNILERLEKHYSGSANKAPYLYRFLEGSGSISKSDFD